MLIRRNRVVLCRAIIDVCHVLVANFTLLRFVEFELVVCRCFVGDCGARNTLIDFHPVLIPIGLLWKQSILERISLDVKCF